MVVKPCGACTLTPFSLVDQKSYEIHYSWVATNQTTTTTPCAFEEESMFFFWGDIVDFGMMMTLLLHKSSTW